MYGTVLEYTTGKMNIAMPSFRLFVIVFLKIIIV